MDTGDFIQLKDKPYQLLGQIDEIGLGGTMFRVRVFGSPSDVYINKHGVRTIVVQETKPAYLSVHIDDVERWVSE